MRLKNDAVCTEMCLTSTWLCIEARKAFPEFTTSTGDGGKRQLGSQNLIPNK